MKSTMQDTPLSIGQLVRYGTSMHASATITTWSEAGPSNITFAELGRRAARLAHGLRALGIDGDQRVATFMWNNSQHMEAYMAVPAMGAVLHTLNIRLFPEQVTYIVNHAEDQVVIVDASLVVPFGKLLPTFETVRHVVVDHHHLLMMRSRDRMMTVEAQMDLRVLDPLRDADQCLTVEQRLDGAGVPTQDMHL